MIPDGYRVVLGYDSESEEFVARVPELGEQVQARAQTRAAALQQVEQQMEDAIRMAAEKNGKLPEPIDAREFSGQLEVAVSAGLHRELAFQATLEGVELPRLCQEILASGLTWRQQRTRPVEAPSPQGKSRGRSGRGRRGGRGGRDYFNIMDDKASFLEYVRNLEPGRGRGGGGGYGRGGRRGNK